MSKFNARIISVSVLVAIFGCGCTHAPTGSVIDERDSAVVTELPTHFILNPYKGPPNHYPFKISLAQIDTFLKPMPVTVEYVGGCGGTEWEGNLCSFFTKRSIGTVRTPWMNDAVTFTVDFAQTENGNFLYRAMLGDNSYVRSNRNEDQLVWSHDYGQERELMQLSDILWEGESADRKKLLFRITESSKGIQLSAFEEKRRRWLDLLLQQCLTDSDPAVVQSAKDLRRSLNIQD